MWKTFTVLYGKFTQDNVYKIHQNQSGFVEDMTKHFGIFFRFTVYALAVKVDDDLSFSSPLTPLPSLLVYCDDICSGKIGS